VGALQGISTPREAAHEAKSSAAGAIIANFAPTGAGPRGGVHSTIFTVEKIYSPPVFLCGRHPRPIYQIRRMIGAARRRLRVSWQGAGRRSAGPGAVKLWEKGAWRQRSHVQGSLVSPTAPSQFRGWRIVKKIADRRLKLLLVVWAFWGVIAYESVNLAGDRRWNRF
jgi:hypothetical protein